MKSTVFISMFASAIMLAGCSQSADTGMITIDVEKSYPKKELAINDLWEVKYIALETDMLQILQEKLETTWLLIPTPMLLMI